MHWSFWLVLRVAGLATAISVAGGLWLACFLSHRKLPLRQIQALLFAPVLIYWLTGKEGLWPLTPAGFVAAGVVSAGLPFLSGARAAIAALDPDYGKAALSLGASPWQVFSRVQLPLAVRPIAAAAGNAFLGVTAELAFVWWLLS